MGIQRARALWPISLLLPALLFSACANFEADWAQPQEAIGAQQPSSSTAPVVATPVPVPPMQPIIYAAPAPALSPASQAEDNPSPVTEKPVTPLPVAAAADESNADSSTEASMAPSAKPSVETPARSFEGVRLMATADSPLTGLDAAAELQWQLSIPEPLAAQWLPSSVRVSVLAPDFNLPSASSACMPLPAQGVARRLSLQPLGLGEFQIGLRARLHDGPDCQSNPSATLDEATVVVVESGPNVDPASPQEESAQADDEVGSSMPWGLIVAVVAALVLLVLFRGRLQQWAKS
nr:hypothetical protein [Oceanococcus sp. HetDA_MAG_MS8]